jgi:modulator of FtsH protease HflC
MNIVKSFAGILIAVAIAVISGATFIVQQTQYALVFQFGEIKRAPITAPGLYFKLPFIQNVVLLDKRILDLDLPEQTLLTADQQNLNVDAFARYKITNPLTFYQQLNSVRNANGTLSGITNSAVRNVLAGSRFTAIVSQDRANLTNKIQDEVNKQARGFGVEMVDVRLTRVNLPPANSTAVFERMKSERRQEAAELRAKGEEFATTIRAKADRDVVELVAEANRKALEARGGGEADRARILNDILLKDPEFFSFLQSLDAYELALKGGNTKMVISPNSPFFKYLNDAKPKK